MVGIQNTLSVAQIGNKHSRAIEACIVERGDSELLPSTETNSRWRMEHKQQSGQRLELILEASALFDSDSQWPHTSSPSTKTNSDCLENTVVIQRLRRKQILSNQMVGR